MRTDDRYEVWSCAKCGAERRQPALPHRPPRHCGTGMWWKELYTGPKYEVDDELARFDGE